MTTTSKTYDKYTVFMDQKNLIGRGAFASVYRCQYPGQDGKLISCCAKVIIMLLIKTNKVLQKSENQHFQRERDIMKNLMDQENKDNIVKVLGVIEEKTVLLIVMELCQFDLGHYMEKNKNLEVEKCCYIIAQIVNGFQPILKVGAVHRDIKPKNILVQGDVFKITDFGFGNYLDEAEKTMTQIGTPEYASPQALLIGKYSNKTDIYSIGTIFYKLIFGQHPLQSALKSRSSYEEALFESQKKPILCPRDGKKPEEVLKLIERMLMFQESERITWEELFVHESLKKYMPKPKQQQRLQTEIQPQKDEQKAVSRQTVDPRLFNNNNNQPNAQVPSFDSQSPKKSNLPPNQVPTKQQKIENLHQLVAVIVAKGQIYEDMINKFEKLKPSSFQLNESQWTLLILSLFRIRILTLQQSIAICSGTSDNEIVKNEQLDQFDQDTEEIKRHLNSELQIRMPIYKVDKIFSTIIFFKEWMASLNRGSIIKDQNVQTFVQSFQQPQLKSYQEWVAYFFNNHAFPAYNPQIPNQPLEALMFFYNWTKIVNHDNEFPIQNYKQLKLIDINVNDSLKVDQLRQYLESRCKKS